MNSSGISASYGGGMAQRILNQLLMPKDRTGQNMPGQAEGPGPPPGAPPPMGPPPGGGPSGQFAASTLGNLLSAQEQTSPFARMASDLISQVDTDKDGTLNLEEITASLSRATGQTLDSEKLGKAIARLDTNGDGKLGTDELSAGLEARARGRHHAHGTGQPPSPADIAARLISQVDKDKDGSLSLEEVTSALQAETGSDKATKLASGLASLDTNGDGKLSASELSAGLDAFAKADRQTQVQTATTTGTGVTA